VPTGESSIADTIRRMEGNLKRELDGRERDVSWLSQVGNQLARGEKGKEGDNFAKETENVQDRWKEIKLKWQNRLNKLREVQEAQKKLEEDLREMQIWLNEFERNLNDPMRFKTISEQEYKAKMKEHNDLEKKINQQSQKVSNILNRGEVLATDEDSPNIDSDLHSVEQNISDLETRWNTVCFRTAEKKKHAKETWERWMEFIREYETIINMISKRLSTVTVIKKDANSTKCKDLKNKVKELETLMKEVHNTLGVLDNFSSVYCNLAREGKLDENGDLKKKYEDANNRWETLTTEINTVIKIITEKIHAYNNFMSVKSKEITWLRQVDAQLTEIEYKTTQSDEEKSRRLLELSHGFATKKSVLARLKQTGTSLAKTCHSEDSRIIIENVNEVDSLEKDVEARLLRLMDDLGIDPMPRFEVDAAVQTPFDSEFISEVGEKSKSQRGTVMITLHKARDLEKKGLFGKADPYAVINVGKETFKSKTIDNNHNPEWNFNIQFNINKETPDKISLEVFDEDIGKDDPLGQTTILLCEIINKRQILNKWIRLQQCKSGEVLFSAEFIPSESPRTELTPTTVFTADTSRDGLMKELLSQLEEFRKTLKSVEENMKIQPSNESEAQDLLDVMHQDLSSSLSLLQICQHCSQELISTHGVSPVEARQEDLKQEEARWKALREELNNREKDVNIIHFGTDVAAGEGASGRSYSSVVKSVSVTSSTTVRPESPPSPGSTCPLCRRRTWDQLDKDLWRLEKWLEYAEGVLRTQLDQGVPGSMELLEDTIQDHREFLMDLDSHKSVMMSINVVGSHLADHSRDQDRANAIRQRLANANERWDDICSNAAEWQTRLQTALLENGEFHRTISELTQWLDTTTSIVRAAEPVDLTQESSVLQFKYNKFLELQSDLQRCEPRIVSLQEAADQLEIQTESSQCYEVKRKLALLSQKLTALIQVCGIYLSRLGSSLGLPPRPEVPQVTLYDSALVLPALSDELLGRIDQPQTQRDDSTNQSDDDLNTGVLSRSYRFLGRVVRAAVPIQALMLLLLGVSSFVPLDQEELICSVQNNLQRSFEPMLRWSNGPPPM